MTRWLAPLVIMLSGCSLLLSDNFDGLRTRVDAGGNAKPQESASRPSPQRESEASHDKPADADAGPMPAADSGGKGGSGGEASGGEGGAGGSLDAEAGGGGGSDAPEADGGAAVLCPDAPCPSKARCLGSGSNKHCECQSGFMLTGDVCVADPCAGVSCGTGGRCRSDETTTWCDCGRGFESAGGTQPCKPIDSCAAENMCTSADYPCQSTVPHYYCQGQFAQWPMPDASPGAKLTPSYDASQEGVVIDEITHLMWQRALPSSYNGCSGGDAASAGSRCSWTEAKAYCSGLDAAGFSDWRLPSKIEHESLVSHAVAAPALDREAFADSGMYGDFWTASSVSGDAASAWIVSTFSGETRKAAVETFSLVRCVRTAREPSGLDPAMHFFGEVDNRTGLRWQLYPTADRFTPAQAVDYCAQLTEDGADWRLPTVKELMTIVDPTRSNPAIVAELDAPGVADDFWASDGSAVPHSGNSTWFVSFKDGSSFYCCYNPQSEQTKRVRCVR